MPKMGDKVDEKRTTRGAPPVVMAAQPDSFIRIESPDDLKQWENDMRSFYGINIESSSMSGSASESCSGGCSDDCDLV